MSFLNYLNPYSYFTTTTPPEERARKREFQAMQREEKESEDVRVVAAQEAAERYLEAQAAARRVEEDMLRREQKKGSEDIVATEAKPGIPRRLDSSRFAFLTSPGGGISGGAGAASSSSVQQRAREYEKLREREPVVEDTVARREAQAIANSGTVSSLPFRSSARVESQVQQLNALQHLNSELQHLLVALKALSAYEEMCTWVIPEENIHTHIRGVRSMLPRPCKIRLRACVTEHDNPQEERVVVIERWAQYGERELKQAIATALNVDVDPTLLEVRVMSAASKPASIVFPVVLNDKGDVEGTFFIYSPSFVKALCQDVDDDGTDLAAKKARLEVQIGSVQRQIKIAEEKRKITPEGGRRRRAQARAQAFLDAVGEGGRFRAYS